MRWPGRRRRRGYVLELGCLPEAPSQCVPSSRKPLNNRRGSYLSPRHKESSTRTRVRSSRGTSTSSSKETLGLSWISGSICVHVVSPWLPASQKEIRGEPGVGPHVVRSNGHVRRSRVLPCRSWSSNEGGRRSLLRPLPVPDLTSLTTYSFPWFRKSLPSPISVACSTTSVPVPENSMTSVVLHKLSVSDYSRPLWLQSFT